MSQAVSFRSRGAKGNKFQVLDISFFAHRRVDFIRVQANETLEPQQRTNVKKILQVYCSNRMSCPVQVTFHDNDDDKHKSHTVVRGQYGWDADTIWIGSLQTVPVEN
jgi:hypothetical protein